MNKTNGPVDHIKIWLGIALVVVVTGCVGYVDGGYYDGGYGGAVVMPAPDVYFWGGGYYGGGHDVHAYSQRGHESRGRR